MLAAWMIYSLAVAGLVGGAALVAERALGHLRLPLRWAWVAAFPLAVALSLLPLVGPSPTASFVQTSPAASVTVGDPVPIGAHVLARIPATIDVPPDGSMARLDLPLAWAWAALASLLLLRLVFTSRTIRSDARFWKGLALPEGDVLVSPQMGPAVVGVLKRYVVLPEWCVALPGDARALVMAHEREHVRAGDTSLVAGALGFLLFLPWNLPLWWYLRRLRVAIEVDCDARVLRAFPGSEREYGELLLMVGSREAAAPLGLAAFSERSSGLARRIERLTDLAGTRSAVRGALFAVGTGLLVLAACLIPGPDRAAGPTAPEIELAPMEAEAEEPHDPAPPEETRALEERPVFTPYTVSPELRNLREVQRRLEEEYPAALRNAGIGGTVGVHVFVDEGGAVRSVQLAKPSGLAALDAAAVSVAEIMEFRPAQNRDQVVPVWVDLPITFRVRDAGPPPVDVGPGDGDAAEAAAQLREDTGADGIQPPVRGAPTARSDVSDGPTFTPYTVGPRVRNMAEVQRHLEEEYPPLLRDAGIGGTAELHLFVDEGGLVRDARVANPSGHALLDGAAVRVARQMEFTPARNRDQVVPVWIAIPITFRTR